MRTKFARFANAVLSVASPSLPSADQVATGAMRRTGLSDCGGDDWREALTCLLEAYHSARLNALGVTLIRIQLNGLFDNRLRTQQAYTQGRGASPGAPLFILGLPRTGSTFLHGALAQLEGLRAPVFAELDHLPDPKPRYAKSALRIALLKSVAPNFRDIHNIGSRQPEECVIIQALSFRSMQFHAMHHIPAYSAWLAQTDWRPAYEWHRKYLHVLTSDPRQWVLKAPGHMHGITALLDTYPEARFVQLHRSPAQTIPSMASLYRSLHHTSSHHVDDHEIGRSVLSEWSTATRNVARVREDAAVNSRFFDLQFEDLIADPESAVTQIASFVDGEITHADNARLNAFFSLPRRPSHRYSLAEFGLDEAQVSRAFDQ